MRPSSDDPLADGDPSTAAAAPTTTTTSTAPAGAGASASPSGGGDDDRVFLVPYRWWREAQEGMAAAEVAVRGVPYAAAPVVPSSYGMKLINMFISDQVFSLRRADDLLAGEEDGVVEGGGRSYALVAADLWSRARAW